jgi:DNA-binding SARP family transcriptional activator
MLDRAAPYIRAPTARPLAQLNWHTWMSLYCSMIGAPVDSLRYANEAAAIATASGIHSLDIQILAFSIISHLSLGNTVAARVLLEREALFANQGPTSNAYYSHHASLVALHEGDILRAVDEGRRAVKFSKTANLFIGTITSLIGLAYAYAQQGDVGASFECLAEAKSKAVAWQSTCFISHCLFCEAILYRIKGDHAQLLESLKNALLLAREGNFVTSAYCPHDIAAQLYALALENNIESHYVRIIIRKTQLLPPRDLLPESWPWRLRFYSLGRFALISDETSLNIGSVAGSKAQKKPLELVRAMAAFGGRDVGIAKLTQALWPDTDGDKARITLRSTLLRLRRLIGEEAIVQNGNYLSLNSQFCWLDIWALEQLSDQRGSDLTPHARAERLFKLYHGAFLPNDDEPWLINQRERLRSKALRLIIGSGAELEAQDQAAAAIAVYQKGLEIDPLAEDIYRKLMQCYYRLGRPAEALALYQRCRAALSRSLQMEPSAETTSLFRDIQQRTS